MHAVLCRFAGCHIIYISRKYGSNSYMKVIGLRSRSQEQKGRRCLFPQCNTLIDYQSINQSINPDFFSVAQIETITETTETITLLLSGSITDRARAKFCVCSIRLSAMADPMVWPPSLSRDRKWLRVTKCTHSRVIGLVLRFFYVHNLALSPTCDDNTDISYCNNNNKIIQGKFIYLYTSRQAYL